MFKKITLNHLIYFLNTLNEYPTLKKSIFSNLHNEKERPKKVEGYTIKFIFYYHFIHSLIYVNGGFKKPLKARNISILPTTTVRTHQSFFLSMVCSGCLFNIIVLIEISKKVLHIQNSRHFFKYPFSL